MAWGDDNNIYLQVSYDEGETEDMKLRREALNSGMAPEEIALEIF